MLALVPSLLDDWPWLVALLVLLAMLALVRWFLDDVVRPWVALLVLLTILRQLPEAPNQMKGGMNKWLLVGLCALYLIPDLIPVLGLTAVIGVWAMLSN
jgi:hypothetical protein